MHRIIILFFSILQILAADFLLAQPNQPNVIFIMADDLGARIGSYDDPMAITPNIDKFSESATIFKNAYCQLPTCGPSRVSMMTGLYPWQTGVYNNHPHFRETIPEVVTLPQLLRQNGYFTVRVGKIYHIGISRGTGTAGDDDPFSWDLTVNSAGWDAKQENMAKVYKTADVGLGICPAWYSPEIPDHEMSDGQAVQHAIKLMQTYHPEQTGKPLMLAVGFYRPHPPMIAPQKYFDMHPLNSVKIPFVPPHDRNDIPPVAFELKSDAFNFIPQKDAVGYTRSYYAAVSFIDAQVGLLVDALKQNGLWENSIVVLVGDQGFHLGEHGHWHKTTLFEEGTKVPLIIRSPAIKTAGKSTNSITELVDIYPTITEILNLEPPHELPGKSLAGQLVEIKDNTNTVALTRVRQAEGVSMRTSRYRLTSWTIDGEQVFELYDHRIDPNEHNNLAVDPEHQELLLKLKHQLNEVYKPEILFKNQ